MKYINKFSTNADYQAFTEGGGYVTPNICYVTELKGLKFKPKKKSAPLITFTINGIAYQAEEGMTWEEWCNSKYNTREFWCVLNNIHIDYCSMIYGETPSDVICNGCVYSSVSYLTILALEDGLKVSLSTNACQYCIDSDGNWIDLPAGTTTQSINQGQTLSFKGNLTPKSSKGIGTFSINKKCNLEGNCMSLLFGDDVANNNSLSGKNYAFYMLFQNCTSIIQVSETFLPATELSTYCYYQMFYMCTSLVNAPALPATTLASSCYLRMFYNCTNLTIAPELLATTLASSCYYGMFHSCSKLNYIKMLATDMPTPGCLTNWVYGVSSTGTFVKNPSMTSLSTGNNGIPSGWTVVDDEEGG